MAEGKKAFVLYADLIHTVSKLSDVKAGKLLKIILDYVNDKNPKDPKDLVLSLAFEPVRRQLKRDLEKYEEKKKQWSLAGKASAAKRKQKSTNVNGRSTDSTVTVTDTVKDTVTVKVKDTDTVTTNIGVDVIDLANEISEKFNFSELSNFNQYSMLCSFIQKNGVEKIKQASDGYFSYKQKTGERLHNIRNWMATGWNEKEWHKMNGTGNNMSDEEILKMIKE